MLGSAVEGATAVGDCVADGEVAAGVLGAAAEGVVELGLSLAAGGDVAGAGWVASCAGAATMPAIVNATAAQAILEEFKSREGR